MNTARVSVCLAILLCGTFVSPLFAQGPGYPGANGYGLPPVGSSSASDASPDTFDIFDNRRFQFRSDIGDGVGYQKGFQTFGAFQPISVIQDELILFMNPRGIVTYTGEGAFNGGLGSRLYNRDTDRIWGLSGWYDYDNTGNNSYDQWGLSFESLGQYLDVRANAYILGNGDRNFIGSFISGDTRFIGNNIGIDIVSQYENPLSGGDFEVGGALPGLGDIGIRTYAGGYYYQGEATGGGVYGVRARGEALITQDFWGGVMVTHDRLFGTNVTGALTWYWGSGQAARWFQRIPVPDRMWQQVERQYRIAVWDDQVTDNILALRNGGTGGSGGPVGSPIFVLHVNNTAAAGGDGTFERPLNALPTTTAGEVDIVFVNRGNGTSSNMNQGITLNNYQRLLGQGVQHLFNSTQGTFVLPGYSPGVLPSITNINAGGDAVTLASFNEVSGFNITGAGRHAIYGNGIDSFNINNINAFSNGDVLTNTGAGIQITNVSGTGLLFDSTLTDNAAEGFRAESTGTALNLAINNVDATGNLSGFVMTGDAATYNVAMTDSTASDNRHDGIAVSMVNGSNFTGVFDNITANSNNNPQVDLLFGNGFTLNADASTVGLNIQHSTFNDNNLNGISVVGVNGSAITLELYNNNTTISNNLLNGLFFDLTDSSGQVVMLNNTFANNGEVGAYLRATGGSLALIAGGLGTEDINGNGQLDPGEDVNGNGVLDFDGNTFDGNHGAGLSYILRNNATGQFDIRGNVFIRTQDLASSLTLNGQGLNIEMNGSTGVLDATATLTSGIIDRNIFGNLTDATLGNVGGGMFILADQQTTIQQLTIGNTDGANKNGNLIANNGGDGIHILRRNEAVVDNVVIQDNTVRFNTGDGLHIEAMNSPNDINDYTINDNIFANHLGGGSGVHFNVVADGQIFANMTNNLITLNSGDGVLITEQVNSAGDLRFVTGLWTRNTITDNTGSGIDLSGRTSGLFIGSGLDADRNLINSNDQDGISISNSGSVFVWTNDITFNGTIGSTSTQGVDIEGASVNIISLFNNYIYHNFGDGVEVLSQGPLGSVATPGLTLDMTQNTIRDNTGRGVDILARVNPNFLTKEVTAISLDSNIIAGNGGEGLYVIYTSSSTQTQDVPSTNLLNSDGAYDRTPFLTLDVIDNRIEGNGTSSSFTGTGLVLRVGTSFGGYGAFSDGGFASEVSTGVVANVIGNRITGNVGDDVYMDSFTSTVDPPTPAGTWSATEFTFTEPYRGDPLARLDLTFEDNVINSAAVNNAQGNTGSQPDSGAFYANADGVFKSRLNTATDGGPFTNASRQRNAQRLAARFTLPPNTPVPPPPNGGTDSGDYLYPGLGQSTFRLLGLSGNTFDPSGLSADGIFTLDQAPITGYTGIGDARGPVRVDSAGLGSIGRMPYGWNFYGLFTSPPRPQ